MPPRTTFGDLPRELRQRVVNLLPPESCDRLVFACASKDGVSIVRETTPVLRTALSTISTASQVRRRCAAMRSAPLPLVVLFFSAAASKPIHKHAQLCCYGALVDWVSLHEMCRAGFPSANVFLVSRTRACRCSGVAPTAARGTNGRVRPPRREGTLTY